MTCSTQNYLGGQTGPNNFETWSHHFSGGRQNLFTPKNLADLVNRVEAASLGPHTVHAVGSGWAFEDIAYSPDWMISLDNLNQPLTNVTGFALNSTWAAKQAAGSDVLFHVEAGIKIYKLNDLLCKQGLALPTLGGSSGQGLAGAISTSTHGGDPSRGPLADMVMAMHLVTTNGREIWIERASQPITDDLALAKALTCPDTEILRNDDVFNAVLIGFGRFGVIYSYVLRVQPAFRLNEWTTKLPAVLLSAKLLEGLATKTFLTPLLQMLQAPPASLGVGNVANPQGLEVAFDTNNLGQCYVKRRWLTTDAADVGMSNSSNALCQAGPGGVLAAASASLLVASPILLANPVGLANLVGDMANLGGILKATPSMTAGDMLAMVLAAFWNRGLGDAIPLIANIEFGLQYQGSLTSGLRGASNLVLSGYPSQSLQDCFRAESIEPIFDAHSAHYINFLQSILADLPKFQVAGYVSLRWSGTTNATMSMHNFPSAHAVAIEVTSLKGLPQNALWMSTVHALAVQQGGRPHWGQINQLNAQTVSSLYGPAVQAWTKTLGALVGNASIFSNPYTQQRGLEPPATATSPTIFGISSGGLLSGFLPAIDLLLGDDVAHVFKPPFKPIPF